MLTETVMLCMCKDPTKRKTRHSPFNQFVTITNQITGNDTTDELSYCFLENHCKPCYTRREEFRLKNILYIINE